MTGPARLPRLLAAAVDQKECYKRRTSPALQLWSQADETCIPPEVGSSCNSVLTVPLSVSKVQFSAGASWLTLINL